MTPMFDHKRQSGWLIFAALISFLFSSLGAALAEEVPVEVTGEGVSRQDAIVAGLASAVEQVSGLKIESSSAMRVELESFTSSKGNENTLAEQQQREVSRQSGGFVKSYSILSEEKESTFTVKLKVVVERFNAPGLPTQDRRRIIVVNPYDLTGRAGPNATILRERLTSYLVQSRRFAVLDRDNDPVFKREINLLRGPDVPVQETVRIGQVLGTDYIVLLKIRAFETQTQSQTVRLTGKTIETKTSKIGLDYSVFEVATRQIKWTGHFADPQELDLSQALDQASTRVGEDILNAIYPLLILQSNANGTVVINQGGETLRVGQQLAAYRLGEPMIDPYTNEPLDRAEAPAGRVVIERVDPKLSYGRIVGAASLSGEGDLILRKMTGGTAPDVSPTSPSQSTGNKPKW